MSFKYTPVKLFDETTREKEWGSKIGQLDWDTTKIVFTKRQLFDFLKYTGTTVDVNCFNIARLPKYAEFGKMTPIGDDSVAAALDEGDQAQHESSVVAPVRSAKSSVPEGFVPTRRVREAPGGRQTISLFGDDEEEPAPLVARVPYNQAPDPPSTEAEPPRTGGFKPTRRVRDAPGGKQSISLFGEDDEEPAPPPRAPPPQAAPQPAVAKKKGPQTTLGLGMFEEQEEDQFVPTRRVRDAPGGHDHIGFD
jgi:hypothetical protein